MLKACLFIGVFAILCTFGVDAVLLAKNAYGCVQGVSYQNLQLSCPAGQVILEIDGIYQQASLNPSLSCSNFAGGVSLQSNQCVSIPSFWVLVAQQCQQRQSCTIPITVQFFSSSYWTISGCNDDSTIQMQALATWSCGPQQYVTGISTNAISRCSTTTENEQVSLSCADLPTSKIIAFYFYNYGVPSQCPVPNTPNINGAFESICPFTQQSNLLSLLNTQCLNQQSCVFTASNGNFNDPCGGIVKDVVIVYGCQVPPLIIAVPTNLTTTNSTTTVGVYLFTQPNATVIVNLLSLTSATYFTTNPLNLTFSTTNYGTIQYFNITVSPSFLYPTTLSLNGSSSDPIYNQASTLVYVNGTNLCPGSPIKSSPGICGCFVADTDTDGDGVADCIDACPTDPLKSILGLCGCFVSDVNYLGWSASCATTEQCCASGGYLGGSSSWQQTSFSGADEVTYSILQTWDQAEFCASPSTPSSFSVCSTVLPASNSTYALTNVASSTPNVKYPTIGSVVPSTFVNYGITCPSSTSCSGLSTFQTIDASTAVTGWTLTTASGAYNGNYLYASPPSSGLTYTFTIPVLNGTFFVQAYSNQPSNPTFVVSRLTYTIYYNGGASTAVLNVTPTGNGWLVLGSWAFTGNGQEKVVISVIDVNSNNIALVDAIQFTSYDPTCDIVTTTAASSATAFFFLPSQTTARFEAAPIGTCTGYVTLYAQVNSIASTTSYYGADATYPRAKQNSAVTISANSSSITVYLYAVLNGASSCTIQIKRSILVSGTVVSVHSVENYIVTQATLTVRYPPQGCLASPVAWTASIEGLERSRGSAFFTPANSSLLQQQKSTSFRLPITVSVPFTSSTNNNRAVAVALPPMLRVSSSASLPYYIWGGSSLGNEAISIGSTTAFSALYQPASLQIPSAFPSGSQATGNAALASLSLSVGTLNADYYVMALTATDSSSSTSTPYDMPLHLLTPVSGNHNPTLNISNGNLFTGCPSVLTVTAQDIDSSDSVAIEYLPWPANWASSYSAVYTTNTQTLKTITFTFTPAETTVLGLMFGAYDTRNGTVYQPYQLNPTSNRGCPYGPSGSTPCYGKGTCNCNSTCTCTVARWTGSDCSTYVNSPPVLSNTSVTLNENSANVAFTLVATDINGDQIQWSNLVVSGFHGTASLASSCSSSFSPTPSSCILTLTPNQNFFTTSSLDSLKLTLTDNALYPASATYNISVTVNEIYIRPTVSNFYQTLNEDCSTQSWTVANLVTNPNSYSLSFSTTSSASLGSLSMQSNGAFTYSCTYLKFGTDLINFRVSDGINTTYAIINITLNFVDHNPVAYNGSFTTNEDTLYSGSLIASDVDNSPFQFFIQTSPSMGTVTLNATNGHFVFTPAAYQPGLYWFSFYVTETGPPPAVPSYNGPWLSSNIATISINSTRVYHPPTAGAVTITTYENIAINGTLAGSDPDIGDVLVYKFVSGSISPSGSGTVIVAASGNAFTYTPTANVFGTTTFNYTVSDGVNTPVVGVVTVNVLNVNQPPTFTLPSTITILEGTGQASTYAGFFQSFSIGINEASSQTLIGAVVTASNTNLFSSQPSLSYNGTNSTLYYTVAANVYGSSVLSVTLQDSGGTLYGGQDTSSIVNTTLTVLFVNRQPSFVGTSPLYVAEDTTTAQALSFASSISLGPAVSESSQVGTFVVSSSYCTSSGIFSSSPVFGIDGFLRFTLNPLTNGNCTYTITLQDNGGVANGGQNTSSAFTVLLIITPVSHKPSFIPLLSGLVIYENQSPNVLYASNISTGAPNEFDTMAFSVSLSGYTASSYFSNLFSPSIPTVSPAIVGQIGNFSGTLVPYANGNVTVTVTLTKPNLNPVLSSTPAAILSLAVLPVNQAPIFVLAAQTVTTTEVTTVTSTSTVIATNIAAGPSNAFDELATQSLSFVITHDCESNGFGPLFSTQPSVSISGSTGTLSFSLLACESTYLLPNNACNVSLTLHDNGGTNYGGVDTSATQRFVLKVTFVNQPPSFSTAQPISLSESALSQTYSQPWASSISAGTNEAWQLSTVVFVLSTTSGTSMFSTLPTISASGVLSFSIIPFGNGSATFSVVLQDGYGNANGGSNSSSVATLVISVLSTQFPVTFNVPPTITVLEGSSTYSSFAITGINASSSVLASTLTATVTVQSGLSLLAGPPTVWINSSTFDNTGANGQASFSFTPGQYTFGVVQVSVTISSSQSSATKSFSINITFVNQPPTFSLPNPIVVYPEDTGSVTLPGFLTSISAGAGNEAGLLGQTVSFNVTCDSNAAVLFNTNPSISSSGTLTFITALYQFGTSTCSVFAIDNLGATSGVQTFLVNLTFWNHNPSFTSGGSVTVLENSGTYSAHWASNVSPGPANEASQTVSFLLIPDTNVGTDNAALFSIAPSINPSGNLTFKPALNQNGQSTITVTLTDSLGAFVTSSFIIYVTYVNQQPSFALAQSVVQVNEYSGSQSISNFVQNASAGPANEAYQTLTFSIASNSNNALFALDSNNNPVLSLQGSSLVFTLASSGTFGSTTINITVQDNGGTANGGINSFSQTFVLQVAFVNTPPTFSCGGSVTVNENTGAIPVTVNNWATNILPGNPSEVGSQNVSFTLTVAPTTPMPINTATLAIDGTTGSLTFSLIALVYGSISVTVQAYDNLGLPSVSTCPLQITVNQVNQQPFFSVNQSVVNVLENSGSLSIAGVFSNISAGIGYGENVQTVAFTVTSVSSIYPSPSSSLSLFASAPTVSSVGTLNLNLSPNLYGNSTISVYLQDNGGTANGGVDTSVTQTILVNVLYVNQAPSVTVTSSYSLNRDSGPQSISGLLTSISAGPAISESWQTVSFSISSISYSNVVAKYSNGALFNVTPSISPSGVISFTTNQDAYGTAVINFRLQDNGGTANGGQNTYPALTSNPLSITFNVNRVNVAPVTQPISFSTPRNTAASFSVLSNDFSNWDFDLGTSTLRVGSLTSSVTAKNGSVSINPNGLSILYTPTTNFYGIDTFSYSATDGSGFSSPALVTVNVTYVHYNPISYPVQFTVVGDGTYTVAASSLFSASDIDPETFTFSLSTQPSQGTASISGGVFTYSPTIYYCGSDSFYYIASDGKSTSNASPVSISITCISHPPVAYNITASMNENTKSTSASVTLSVNISTHDAADVGKLTYSCSSGFTFGLFSPALNTVSSTSTPIVYSPTAYKNGIDVMACTAFNPANQTANFWVIITVIGPLHHPPVIDQSLLQLTGYEDVPGGGNLLAEDYDGNALTYTFLTTPPASICTVALNPNNGSFTYISALHQFGICTFNWTVADAYNPSGMVGVVIINILPVTHTPTAQNCIFTAYENILLSSLQLATTNIDANQGTTLTYQILSPLSNSFGTLQNLNPSTGIAQFLPATNVYGTTSFAFQVTSSAGLTSNVATATINIVHLNQPPIAYSLNVTTKRNTPINITLPYYDVDTPLSNETFAITNNVRAVIVAPQTALYTPSLNFYGSDSFTFSVNDGQYSSSATVYVTITYVNYPPIAQNGTWNVQVNIPYTDSLQFSDIDTPASTLTVTIVTAPKYGNITTDVTPGNNQVATYTPFTTTDPSFSATDSFQFYVNDSLAFSNIATMIVNIQNSPYQRPIAYSANITTLEETPVSSTVTGSDPNNIPFTFTLVSSPSHGQLTFSQATGAFTYQPSYNFFGTDSFTFRTQDAHFSSFVATVTLIVTYVIKHPVVTGFSFSTNENIAYSGQLQGSDADPVHSIVSYYIQTPPAHGTITLTGAASSGTFSYTPNLNYYGPDSFTYSAYDGMGYSNLATVTITVNHVNQPPIAINALFSTNRDTVLTQYVTASDPDIPTFQTTSSLTYSIIPAPTGAARTSGTVKLNSATGQFVYTPANLFYGPDVFYFNVSDGQLYSVNPGVISITVVYVEYPPTANAQSVVANENTPITITLSGSDVDGHALTYALTAQTTAAGGTVTQSVPSSNTVVYTPSPYYVGADSFTFTCSNDKYQSVPATVSITVNRVPIPPVVDNTVVSVLVDQTITITVVATDVDPAAVLYMSGFSTPSYGTAVLLPDPPLSFSFTAPSTAPGQPVIVTVTIATNFGSTSTGNVTIYISEVQPSPPIVGPLSFSGTEDQPLQGTLSVLASSSQISLYNIVGLTSNYGTLTSNTDLSSGVFEIQPGLHYYGTFTFQYQAVDSQGGVSNLATVTITFVHVNYPPQAVALTLSIPEGTPITFQLQATDPNGLSSFTYSLASRGTLPSISSLVLSSSTGTCTFTPPSSFVGNVVFYYSVNDGILQSSSASVTISVLPVDHAPVAANVTVSGAENSLGISGALSCTDIDGQGYIFALQSSTTSLPGQLTLNTNTGAFTFVPSNTAYGVYPLNYVCSNTLISAPAYLTIILTKVNKPPVAYNLQISVNENSQHNYFQASAIDNDSGFLFSLVSNPYSGTVAFGDDGSFDYAPTKNFYGSDNFTFIATDYGGLDSNVATVFISVLQVFTPPTANPASITLHEDSFYNGLLTGSSIVPSTQQFLIKINPSHGTLNLTDPFNGNFIYTPNYLFFGSDLAVFSLHDSIAESSVAVLAIQVIHVNHAPVAYNASITVTAGVSYVGTFLATDVDVGDTLTYAANITSTSGTVTVQNNQYVYMYATNSSTQVYFMFRAFDQTGAASNYAYISVTVNPAAPAADGHGSSSAAANTSGSNITVPAIVAAIVVVAALIAALILYRYWQQNKVKAFEAEVAQASAHAATNPLYVSLNHENFNPLYEETVPIVHSTSYYDPRDAFVPFHSQSFNNPLAESID